MTRLDLTARLASLVARESSVFASSRAAHAWTLANVPEARAIDAYLAALDLLELAPGSVAPRILALHAPPPAVEPLPVAPVVEAAQANVDAPRAPRKARGDGVRQSKGWEKRREAHERATAEVEAKAPDFLPLWRLTHAQYKGTPERRAEAFMEYAYAHGGEVTEAMQAEADEATREGIAGLLASYETETTETPPASRAA